MKNLVSELKKILPLKSTTSEGDVIVVAAKQPQMLFYGYINKIERDTSRRDEWWHIHFNVLSVPLQQMTWTLRTAQMTGQEIFTMGGEERFVQAVDFSAAKDKEGFGAEPEQKPAAAQKGKISPLKRVK